MEVTRFEQRAYIKIAILRERNAMECHSELVEALRNNALPCHTIALWLGKFQQGRVSTSDEQRSGKPVSERTDLHVPSSSSSWITLRVMDYIKSLQAQVCHVSFMCTVLSFFCTVKAIFSCILL
ncbi:uncharacterized protein TNCV_3493411 [Trichonephila clavipes]|nr:uncharacterized protein TNCV_3493411 [Trichonephila clavipes]